MALEIERRFLVRGDHWRPHCRWSEQLEQGYLVAEAEGPVLRVRRSGQAQAWLTLKLPAAGLARQEFEYAIPTEDAATLLGECATRLTKTRFGLDLADADWVLDVFAGANAPLVIAEAELERADQALQVPPWCGLEISGQGEFSNAALARRPFATWPRAERERVVAAMGAERP